MPALQKYDLWFPAEGWQRQRTVKPNVVLAAYETVRTDKGLFQASLRAWQSMAAPACPLHQLSSLCLDGSPLFVSILPPVAASMHLPFEACFQPQAIPWETVIIDEAHRMKSTGSSTRAAVVGMDISWLLLLTGAAPQAAGCCCARLGLGKRLPHNVCRLVCTHAACCS